MIKITLPNGVVVEADSASEAGEVLEKAFVSPTQATPPAAELPAAEEVTSVTAIFLSKKLFEVYDVISLFPQGISSKNVASLLNIKMTVACSRAHALHKDGLIEAVPHHRLWRVTSGKEVLCEGKGRA